MYPMIDKEETGRNIARIMKEKGITVKDVQAYLNLGSDRSIYHWLEGRNVPSIDNLYALKALFGVSVDSIICGNLPAVYPAAGEAEVPEASDAEDMDVLRMSHLNRYIKYLSRYMAA